MAVDHDKKTLEWKSQHEVAYLAKQKIVKEQDVTFQEATQQYNVENEKPTQYQVTKIMFYFIYFHFCLEPILVHT